MPRIRRKASFPALLLVSALALAGGCALQLLTGAYDVSAWDAAAWEVVWTLRLPRVVCGCLVGAGLACAGAVFQAITLNEMASPYLLGVSQGAGLAVTLVLALAPALAPSLPLCAMVGALAAFFLVYAIAWKGGASPVRLVLAGVVLGSVVGSVQTALSFCLEDVQTAQAIVSWLAGSLAGAGWTEVRRALPWTAAAVAGMFVLARHMDMLLLGEDGARVLGVPVNGLRFALALLAALASASAVSAAGLVGFVGLVVPHAVRTFTGPDHRRLLAGCLVAGPALLVVSDAAARLLVRPMQLPVGVVTGVLGGIFFLALLRTGRRRFAIGGRDA